MIFSVLCFRVIIGISNIFYKGRVFSLLGMYSVEVYLSEWVSSGVYIRRYLWRWALVMEAVVWLLGPPPLQDCWLLCVRGSLAQGPPFLGGGPNQLLLALWNPAAPHHARWLSLGVLASKPMSTSESVSWVFFFFLYLKFDRIFISQYPNIGK